MINRHKSNKIKENSNTVRHLNNGTDHRHSKSCCDQSSPARRTIMVMKIKHVNMCVKNAYRLCYVERWSKIYSMCFAMICLQSVGLPVCYSWPICFMMMGRIFGIHLIINNIPKMCILSHCLGLGHWIMAYGTLLRMFWYFVIHILIDLPIKSTFAVLFHFTHISTMYTVRRKVG